MTLQNMTCLNFKAVEFPRPGSQWRQGEMKGRSLEEGSRVPCPCLLDGEAGTSPVENDVYPLNLPGSQAFARAPGERRYLVMSQPSHPSMRVGYQEPLLIALILEPCPMGSQSLVSSVTCLIRVLHENYIRLNCKKCVFGKVYNI